MQDKTKNENCCEVYLLTYYLRSIV